MSIIFNAKDLRHGHTILYKNQPHLVLEHSFNKTAMRAGIIKCKIKNLITKAITIEEFTGTKVEQALLVNFKAHYSYEDDKFAYFINQDTYEEIVISLKDLVKEKNYFSDDLIVDIIVWNDKIINVVLPEIVSVILTNVEEAVRGDTAANFTKLAWTATGFEINVPSFIKENEKIYISTIDGKYKSR